MKDLKLNWQQNLALHKANLNKCKKIEITLCILSDHNAVKLELNNKRSSRKYANN
jgi:hypothetical protein